MKDNNLLDDFIRTLNDDNDAKIGFIKNYLIFMLEDLNKLIGKDRELNLLFQITLRILKIVYFSFKKIYFIPDKEINKMISDYVSLRWSIKYNEGKGVKSKGRVRE
ncbi:MAG: hypothetical protein ACTSPQ_21925 [Candidatus Helarchaeota archaeon]